MPPIKTLSRKASVEQKPLCKWFSHSHSYQMTRALQKPRFSDAGPLCKQAVLRAGKSGPGYIDLFLHAFLLPLLSLSSLLPSLPLPSSLLPFPSFQGRISCSLGGPQLSIQPSPTSTPKCWVCRFALPFLAYGALCMEPGALCMTRKQSTNSTSPNHASVTSFQHRRTHQTKVPHTCGHRTHSMVLPRWFSIPGSTQY